MTILNLPDEEHLQFEIARLEMKPGDVLVARLLRPAVAEAMARAKIFLERAIPNTKVLVIDYGLELSVVSKTEGKRLAKETA